MNVLRKLLLPIVPFYYVITWVRNKLYDIGVFTTVSYDFPVIAVGNLSVGGTGKSPMVEYLVGLLKDSFQVATLSRGYKRKTSGFQLVTVNATAEEVGDEPLQFKTKFEEVLVAVDADRRNGISSLRKMDPRPELILLDDAYQHRKVNAGFYILLTAYYDLYLDDIVLPTGNLREPISGVNRANMIVVTKCPKVLTIDEQQIIERRMRLRPDQQLFFATIAYQHSIVSGEKSVLLEELKDTSFTLVTGIANPAPLVAHYERMGLKFVHKKFPDHHNFTDKEIAALKQETLLVTTEKDYMRLKGSFEKGQLWYQPIQMELLGNKEHFEKEIINYAKKK
ncbi:tetraacyldisaccharide 4'-kinase [Aquimarina sp. TRL1]|uniref:tetraacyldisaccharide 4'-kinase n=1 Tax=Aquimarina sp. (strain TRL1) TaxID=2736252 RepID=UPI00158A0459|nr:tetraacyldisaccharide 4'-kinase [Aquimarina sp. TRL1]QKX03520.1 tetraacyldisaccharide 4'-kinase [Aquimarina sp. TRL1]